MAFSGLCLGGGVCQQSRTMMTFSGLCLGGGVCQQSRTMMAFSGLCFRWRCLSTKKGHDGIQWFVSGGGVCQQSRAMMAFCAFCSSNPGGGVCQQRRAMMAFCALCFRWICLSAKKGHDGIQWFVFQLEVFVSKVGP